MGTLEPWIAKARSLWLELKPAQRIVVAAVIALGFASAAYFAIAPTKLAYQPLYRDLATGDLHEIQQVLGKDGVPFRQDERSGTIEVPAEAIEKVRMRLAAEGLPRQGGPGFELFESSRFGQTEFDQKIALQRALEGELARTIRGLDSVEAVRVHLVLPAHELFRSSASPASASVVLRLHAGRGLTPTQVGGIVHLVSSAVAGLEPNQVTVIDQHGTLLTSGDTTSDDGEPTDAKLAQTRHSHEVELERRIEALLVPIVGAGHVVARVGVEFDVTRRETSEVRYDPDTTAIRSESRSEDKQAQSGAGSASVTANVPGAPAGAPPGGGPSGRATQQSTINYEVSKVETRSILPAAKQRVTAAVLVDGTYGATADGKAAERTSPCRTP
ncbi:MAG: flagellar basal-body MS-ring/collar protein FliF [bacterium]